MRGHSCVRSQLRHKVEEESGRGEEEEGLMGCWRPGADEKDGG